MQVRCWWMEWTSWSFLRKLVAQMASMTQLPLVSPTTQPALSLWPWALVWWSPRSAVSSCPNNP